MGLSTPLLWHPWHLSAHRQTLQSPFATPESLGRLDEDFCDLLREAYSVGEQEFELPSQREPA